MTNQTVQICGEQQVPREWKATTFVYDDDGVSIESAERRQPMPTEYIVRVPSATSAEVRPLRFFELSNRHTRCFRGVRRVDCRSPHSEPNYCYDKAVRSLFEFSNVKKQGSSGPSEP